MIKNLAKKALVGSGALRWMARRRAQGVAILMYHSVMDDPTQASDSLGGIIHSRRAFEGQMELLARKFQPVDLEQVENFLTGDSELPERAVVVTFDDGYTDNEEVAMPILDRLGIPATFYVTVDCLERRALPWPSRLRYAFRASKKKSWADDVGTIWTLSDAVSREHAYLSACDHFCKLAGTALEAKIACAERDLDAHLPVSSGQLMMTWEQVRKLAKGGHLVGSHTMTHPNMAFLDVNEVRRELTESKQIMETRLGRQVDHFSYPCPALYPNWTKLTLEESQSAGYRTAVTTNNGVAHARDNPLELKRLRPTKTADGLRWNLESAFAGRAV
jgi:peptidoglycan/xylan/chitin deacetylase (PgdA/CDA1 family)